MNIYGGTSFPEQVIYGYIKEFFPDALNREKIHGVEADVFIPSIKCVVEVDGGFWHDNKIEKDNEKNHFFNRLGMPVIRIREKSLGKLADFNGVIITAKLSVKTDLVDAINLLMPIFGRFFPKGELKNKLESFHINNYDLDVKAPKFLSTLLNKEVHPNVLDYAGGQLWDYELNGDLNPRNVNMQNCQDIPLNFKCPEKKITRKRMTRMNLNLKRWCVDFNDIDQNDREEVLMFEFKKKECTMVRHCGKKCEAFKKFISFMIENYLPVYPSTLSTNLLAEAVFDDTKKLVDALLKPECKGKFLQSMRYIHQCMGYSLPKKWIKNENDEAK